MRNFLLAVTAASPLLFVVPVASVEAAPLVGGAAMATQSPTNIEAVTFFRCGIFGNRCRGDYRRYRRGYSRDYRR